MSTIPALIVAWTTPFSPTMRVSVDAISPRNFPFSITVPLNVYFPSISDPSSMKAVRSPVLTGRLPLFFHSIGHPCAASVAPAAVHATTLAGGTRVGHARTSANRDLLVEHVDRMAAGRLDVVDLDDVAVEEAALGDDQGVR